MSKRKRYQKNIYQEAPKQPVRNVLVDIVIPVYNRFDLLERCLDAIPSATNGITYSITCVDNNSSLAERDKFYSSRKDIVLIQNKDNLGFPKACNQGASRGTAPLIFFLNSDVILEPESIEKLVTSMDDSKVGVAGMLLKFPEYAEGLNPNIRPSGKVQHVGMETDIHGKWKHVLVGWSIDNPRVLERKECYAVTGAALMTRRSLWRKIGGFLEEYGLGTYEDTDYCLSVRDLGYNILVNTSSIGTHFTGATAESQRIPYPLEYNRFVFLKRWSQKLMWTEWSAY